uniref:RING-type domain-containing protein n=1 Tax=Strigamia maritima TaxID=126957 RepID=T1J8W5_STRMM
MNLNSAPINRQMRDEELMNCVRSSLVNGGNVLIPLDAAGRVLEVACILDQKWQKYKLLGVFVGAVDLIELSRVPDPKVVMASSPDLEFGFSRDVFLDWCSNSKNRLILTTRTSSATLARNIIDNPEIKNISLEVRKRVKSESREFEEYLSETKEKVKKTDCNKLMQISENKFESVLIKERLHLMFPFEEEAVDYDDYGASIDFKDFLFSDFNCVEETVAKKEEFDEPIFDDVVYHVIRTQENFTISCSVKFIDFEGKCDGESWRKMLFMIKPRRLIIVRGSRDSARSLGSCCGKLFTPRSGEYVDVSMESHVYSVKMNDLLDNLSFIRVKDAELAWVDGEVGIDDDNCASILGNKTPDKDVPVFLGGFKLLDFRQVLKRAGISSEFSGGVLSCCKGAVLLRFNSSGGISLAGCYGEEYYKVDANELNTELYSIYKSQILLIFKYLKPEIITNIEPELNAILRFAICKFSLQAVHASIDLRLEYLSILERFLCIRSVPAAPHNLRQLTYQYMMREILWHGFAEFLTVIIPLLNRRKIQMYINKCLPTSKGSISSDAQTCGICGETPCLPHVVGCKHVFCYFCIKAKGFKFKLIMASFPVVKLGLYQPEANELQSVLEKGLKNSFEEASVQIIDCPNLEKEPFNLAAKGICGRPTLIDVGGVRNLQPVPMRNKVYNLDELTQMTHNPDAFLMGAGGGPFHVTRVNCEFMANIRTSVTGHGRNLSYIARLDSETEYKLLQIPENRECGLMLNALVCEGTKGKVMYVRAKKRTRDTNFITAMRETLKVAYGNKPIGLGGVFLLQKGNAKLHIMPDFPIYPLIDEATVNSWLKFYDMHAPLVCLSTFVTHDPLEMDLRIEHTHCYSNHGQGGHYHYDTTPDTVEYMGYFVPCSTLYRIDKPPVPTGWQTYFKLHLLVTLIKISNVFLISLEEDEGLTRPVFLEARNHYPQRSTDWRVVHTIGWILGVIVLILEFIVIFDSVQCLLFPLKAYLQSSCILSSFCFASALPLYELQMSLYVPWINDSVHCPRAADSPFSLPWSTFPPFTSSLMPPYGSPTSIPLMNPTAGPPMSPSFFPPAPSGGFPLFCADMGRFPQTAFMQQVIPNSDTNNCSFNNYPTMTQRTPSPGRAPSPFGQHTTRSQSSQSQGTSIIIEEQQ